MAGIIVDSQRLQRTRTDFADIFAELGDVTLRELRELKSNELYRGRGPWQGIQGNKRVAIISRLCEWLADRKHDIALAAIDLEKHAVKPLHRDLDVWMAAALHIALQVQRAHQRLEKRKGATFLVFDEHRRHADRLAELLFDPPEWTDEFYGRGPKQEPLDQLIDTSFYARSHHVGLVQIADLFAFLFRRYSELRDFQHAPTYDRELERINGWVETISERLIPAAHRWPKRSRGRVSDWYNAMAPPSLLALT